MADQPDILDELLKGCKTPADVDALHAQLLQRMINRALDAEMDNHLGYEKGERSTGAERRANLRNGKTTKTVKGTFGELEITTPRDRDGSFEPQLVQKRQVRLYKKLNTPPCCSKQQIHRNPPRLPHRKEGRSDKSQPKQANAQLPNFNSHLLGNSVSFIT